MYLVNNQYLFQNKENAIQKAKELLIEKWDISEKHQKEIVIVVSKNEKISVRRYHEKNAFNAVTLRYIKIEDKEE